MLLTLVIFLDFQQVLMMRDVFKGKVKDVSFVKGGDLAYLEVTMPIC